MQERGGVRNVRAVFLLPTLAQIPPVYPGQHFEKILFHGRDREERGPGSRLPHLVGVGSPERVERFLLPGNLFVLDLLRGEIIEQFVRLGSDSI